MRQLNGSVSVDEEIRVCSPANVPQEKSRSSTNWPLFTIIVAVAAPIYLGCVVSPPSLMDDVDAPQVYIDDAQFRSLWLQPERRYLLARESEWPRFERLVGREPRSVVAVSGGKFLATNHPLEGDASTPAVAGVSARAALRAAYQRRLIQ